MQRAAAPEPPPIAPRRRDNPWLRRLVLFATCVLMANALIGERGLAQTMRARREFAQAAVTVAELRARNAGLREQARRLQDDPGAIEAVAREELGLIRPGEILIVVKNVR